MRGDLDDGVPQRYVKWKISKVVFLKEVNGDAK